MTILYGKPMEQKSGGKLNNTERRALELYHFEGKTMTEAYMLTHNCKLECADANASKFFKIAENKLSQPELLMYYGLGPRDVLRSFKKLIKAKTHLTYKGLRTGDKVPDNTTREKATEALARMNGMVDSKHTEITAEGGDSLHIVIDNG